MKTKSLVLALLLGVSSQMKVKKAPLLDKQSVTALVQQQVAL
jgi:hypothetical protein